MTTVLILLSLVVAVQTVLLLGLLRSHADILRRLHELGAGLDPDAAGANGSREAPADGVLGPPPAVEGRKAGDLSGTTPTGEVVAIPVAGVDHDTALVFLSSACAGCQEFWPALADPQVPDGTRVVVVTREEPDEDADDLRRLAPGVTVVMSDAAWEQLGVPGSPYVVLVDGATGRVRGEGTAGSWPALRRLLLRGTGTRTGGKAGAGTGRERAAADLRRELDADRHLLAAGISPGDPSLYRRADGTAVERPE